MRSVLRHLLQTCFAYLVLVRSGCLPAWGTSDAFRLLNFLWINQPNTELEDPVPLLDAIQRLDTISSKPSIKIPKRDVPARISGIVKELSNTYGSDALLRRYNEALGHSSISLMHQHQVRVHVFEYGGDPLLCGRLWDAGVVGAYIQSHRRKQESGDWSTYDATLFFDFIL